MKFDNISENLRNLPPVLSLHAGDETDEDEDEEEEREVKKLPYLAFDKREARGETVNRSVLTDPKYDESGKLIGGLLLAVPSDFNPETHRIPGRKFWADELDLLSLKISAYDAKISKMAATRQEMVDTKNDLAKIGDPSQRAAISAARRMLSGAAKSLAKSGSGISLEDLMKKFLSAKS